MSNNLRGFSTGDSLPDVRGNGWPEASLEFDADRVTVHVTRTKDGDGNTIDIVLTRDDLQELLWAVDAETSWQESRFFDDPGDTDYGVSEDCPF